MNLIEQLGGYRMAKEVFEQVKARDHKHSQNLKLLALDRALLEYRRAHNIFENGDKVVHIHDCENSMLFTVKDISSKGYSFGNDWGWYGVISNMGVGYTFRHATSEEKTLNRRL